jgi:hypothetical protein
VDSDYVIIAASTIERLGHTAPRIFVRRLVLHPTNGAITAVGGTPDKKNAKKRPLESDDTHGPVAVKRAPREYEFADCNRVVDIIRKTFGGKTPIALRPYTVQIFSFGVALCGCDFTYGVSWLSGSAFWKNGPALWPGICAAASVDPATKIVSMDPRIIAEKVIGVLWKKVQFKKFGVSTTSFEQLYKELAKNEAISAFRRERLITPERLCCLVKGCNWTAWYWSNCETCPCALNGGIDYGFVMGKKSRVEFDDKKALPAA